MNTMLCVGSAFLKSRQIVPDVPKRAFLMSRQIVPDVPKPRVRPVDNFVFRVKRALPSQAVWLPRGGFGTSGTPH